MSFKKLVKTIQTMDYNGAHTVNKICADVLLTFSRFTQFNVPILVGRFCKLARWGWQRLGLAPAGIGHTANVYKDLQRLCGDFKFMGIACILDTFQNFLITEHMKPRMHILEISISSLNHVIIRPTKTPKSADKKCQFLTFKVNFLCQKLSESF